VDALAKPRADRPVTGGFAKRGLRATADTASAASSRTVPSSGRIVYRVAAVPATRPHWSTRSCTYATNAPLAQRICQPLQRYPALRKAGFGLTGA
jgi:hypothetical protein